MTTSANQTLRTYVKCLLDQGADMAVYADSLADRLGVTKDDVLKVAATLGPARAVNAGDLASERRSQDARMTRAQRASVDHEED